MAWSSRVEEVPDLVPENIYNVEIAEIVEQEGPYGPMAKIVFTLSSDDEFNERRVYGICNSKISESSKLGRWIAAITGKDLVIGEEFNEDMLLYKKCRVVVKHENKDGKIFANVTEVLQPTSERLNETVDFPF